MVPTQACCTIELVDSCTALTIISEHPELGLSTSPQVSSSLLCRWEWLQCGTKAIPATCTSWTWLQLLKKVVS